MTQLVAFLLLIGPLITVHELGHFLMAKWMGVRVLTFSLGFGPRLFGVTRNGTEYRLGLIPLGGYVRMYGEDIAVEVPAAERQYAFLEKAFWPKMAIAFAGPLFNLILPVGLFFFLFLGSHQQPAAVLGTLLPGEPAEVAGLRSGDRVVAVDGAPVRLFAEMTGIVQASPSKPLRFQVERGAETLEVVATPRAVTRPPPYPDGTTGRLGAMAGWVQPIVTSLSASPAEQAGIKSAERVHAVDGKPVRSFSDLEAALAANPMAPIKIEVERLLSDGPGPTRVVELSPAAPAVRELDDDAEGSRNGAKRIPLLRFAVTRDELALPRAVGQPLVDDVVAQTREVVEAELIRVMALRGLFLMESMVEKEVAPLPTSLGPLRADVDRIVAVDGRPVTVAYEIQQALTEGPDDVHVIGVLGRDGRSRVLAFRLEKSTRRTDGGQKVFWVRPRSVVGGTENVTVDTGPLAAAQQAAVATGTMVVAIGKGLLDFFTGRSGLDQLGGPLTIAEFAGEAADNGATDFLALMATFSVNLALLNLLPIPVLDGGHMMLFTVEAIRRRRLSPEARMRVTQVGLLLVGGLMVFVVLREILEVASRLLS